MIGLRKSDWFPVFVKKEGSDSSCNQEDLAVITKTYVIFKLDNFEVLPSILTLKLIPLTKFYII